MPKRISKCIECVLSEPLTEKIGSLKDGERYYFMIAGKQRRCIPRDRNIRRCQQIRNKNRGDGNSTKRRQPGNNNLPEVQHS